MTAGVLEVYGELDMSGGSGGDNLSTGSPVTYAESGGAAGSLTISGGASVLSGTVSLRGGRGGDNGGNGNAGDGRPGGVVTISGGTTRVAGTLDLSGGRGGNNTYFYGAGNGARGGRIVLSSGELILQGGEVRINGGDRGIADFDPDSNNGTAGTNGWVTVTGGTLTLDTGTILGRAGVASADPLTLANADLNISGGNVIATNPLTVSGGGADLNISGGAFTADTVREAAGGDVNLSGTGRLEIETFEGALTQTGGTLLIGSSPGITDITDAYNLSGGVLEIELFGGGASPIAGVDFDQLSAGSASLGGELLVLLDSAYTPTLGDSFPIITTTNGVSGSFATESLPTLSGGLGIELRYGSHSVDLLVTSALAGDFNQDGDVDGDDFLAWQRDPSVGTLAEWRTSYGFTAPLSPASNTVPEPSGILVAVTALALTSGHRRRQASLVAPTLQIRQILK